MAETTTTSTQWPLSAAATDVLVGLPSLHSSDVMTGGRDLLKLCIKELMIRRAVNVQVERPGHRKQKVNVTWLSAPGDLPVPLGFVDAALRSGGNGELAKVVKRARKRNPGLQAQALQQTLEYLASGGLAVKQREKTFAIFTTERWRRTQLGDQWAHAAHAHHDALSTQLPMLKDSRPTDALRLAAAAGALVLFVPGALALIAGLWAWLGDDHHVQTVDLVSDDMDFVSSIGDAFDAIASGFDGAIDAVGGAVDSAIDAIGSSIDGAIDSAVDAGGGGCGGGSDGGGGDSGGGGCGGGCGGGGGGD